jgi:LmbE family N-acetylglucosaminyl deacetylase
MAEWRRILAIGAHADDVELGCGGTLARARREGREVFVLTLSKHDPWFDGTKVQIDREWHQSLDRLGVGKPQRRLETFLGCQGDDFQRRRADLLRIVEEVRDAFRPDTVLFHSRHDTNQDHQQVHAEVVRALKRHATLLGYEFPNNQLAFDGRLFVALDEQDLATKCDALSCYRSLRAQWEERNERYRLDTLSYLDPAAVRALAQTRGIQAGGHWAECFETERVIWR